MTITQEVWGTHDELPIILYTMTNAQGEWVKLTNLGATVVGAGVRDNKGNIEDVILGYKDFKSYVCDGPAMGKSVGRYANRIAAGKFTLEGNTYNLAVNNGPNHLHGGPSGFQNRVWEGRIETDRIVFAYHSENGEEGYPGDMYIEAVFDWDDDSALEITYRAKANATTIVNLTNHLYLNLKGASVDQYKGGIEDHTLKLYAAKFLPTNDSAIPTGELQDVTNTPMDFIEPHVIGERINEPYEHLIIGKGYDHCWAVDGYEKDKFSVAAELSYPENGRVVEVITTQPGIQIYTGNWLSGSPENKTGGRYNDRDGVALECQSFPDTPNKPQFPSCVLEVGDMYEQRIIYKFKTI